MFLPPVLFQIVRWSRWEPSTIPQKTGLVTIFIIPNSNPPDAVLREDRLHLHLLPVAGLRQGEGPHALTGQSQVVHFLHHYWVILVSHIELPIMYYLYTGGPNLVQ